MNTQSLKHLLCLLVACLTFMLNASAQRERNYIYVLDCTRSMTGVEGNRDIWQPTKDYLSSDIRRHALGTEIHVLPFQNKVLKDYCFYAEQFNWGEMEKELDKFVQIPANTNICDAWDAASSFVDQNKDNYIYLLTDGQDNVKGMAELARRLGNFCGKYRNTRAFYVVLTTKAIDPKIREIVDNCPDERFVDASKHLQPFGSFDDNVTIYGNTLALNKVHRLSFSAAGEYNAKIVGDDPNFDVVVEGGRIANGQLTVKINAKKPIADINAQLPETYNFDVKVEAQGVEVINPTVHVKMTNKPERLLEIVSEEQNIGTADWYDSFLFWGAKAQDTLKVDLQAVFNAEAVKDGSTTTFKVEDVDGTHDYTLFWNGQPVRDGIISMKAGETGPSMLSLVFNDNAKEGKHYLRLVPQGATKLESINGAPVTDYELTLRSIYDVDWNPLKTFLFWLGIIILTALILWFLVLRQILYPTFKVGSITINDPYYTNVRLKGARRLVFCNKRQEQSMLSRIFTRPILYNVNAVWTQPLTMEPAKKKIRVIRNKTYVFDPYGSLLNGHTEYKVENTESNEKIAMTLN